MFDYFILIVIILFIYFVLVRNKGRLKSEWESLPSLLEYKKKKKALNDQQKIICIHCGNKEFIKKPLKDKKENPNQTKFYHVCTHCRVILWRSEV
jgi:DNA-directed RNA polymerase subunit M/transcription elongation factor TFIIS